MARRPKIAILTANQGHASLAEAAAEAVGNRYHLDWYREKIIGEKPYLAVYRFFPQLFGLPYYLTQWPPARLMINSWFRHHYRERLSNFFQTTQPDLCISTYFAFNPTLESLCQSRHLPLINVVANPLTTHPLEIAAPPSINLVFDERQLKLARRL